MPSPPAPTTLTLRCHCALHAFPLSFPTRSLPTPAWYCHCSICRHATGAPFIAHLALPAPPFGIPDGTGAPQTMSAYSSSETGRRWFCAVCGTHMAMSSSPAPSSSSSDDGGSTAWVAALGAVDLPGGLRAEQVYEPTQHYDVGSTGDGGLARWADDGLPKWVCGPSGGAFGFPSGPRTESGGARWGDEERGEQVLRASCQCRGVRLDIMRPCALPRGPGVHERGTADGRRWCAKHCFCADCRRALGHPVASFVCVGREHVRFERRGTLRVWKSAGGGGGVRRTFCGMCGASVMYEAEGEGWVGVMLGLVDVGGDAGRDGEAEQAGLAGVLGEWVEWADEFGVEREARDPVLRDALRRGMRGEGVIGRQA